MSSLKRLPIAFHNFLLDYQFLCENLRTNSPHCQFTRVLAIAAEITTRQIAMSEYVGQSDGKCQQIFFGSLLSRGVKHETLERLDLEYTRLQDERVRVNGMSKSDFRAYCSETFKALRKVGV